MTSHVCVSTALLFAAATSLSLAASPDDYLKERDRASAEVSGVAAKGSDDAAGKVDAKALDDLQTTLRGVIPQHHVKGFPAQGAITLRTLVKGATMYGGLDGLAYTANGDQEHLVVTSKALLDAWLTVYRGKVKLPADLAGVASSAAFFGGVINDAGSNAYDNANTVLKYADIPVKQTKAGGVVKAVLFTQGEDKDPNEAPTLVGVALIQGDRVYVRWDQTTAAPAIPGCVKAFSGDASADGRERDFFQCYSKRLATQAGYQAVVKQAQGIVDELSAAE
jgi:hypothetical protein